MIDSAQMPYAELLYVSDDPERFSALGRLFHADMPASRAIRFYYDHVNGTGGDAILLAAIVNTGNDGAVSILGAACVRVYNNFMDVGHSATHEYLRRRLANTSQRIPLAGGEAHLVEQRVVHHGECIAGTFDVFCDGAGPYEIRVVACDANATNLRAELDNTTDLLPDGKQRRGVFNIAGSSALQTMTYGSAPIVIGPTLKATDPPQYKRDPIDPYTTLYSTNGGKLINYAGEYGILKRFECVLPTNVQNAWLYQSANGGNATGSYIVDGALIGSRKMPVQARSKITPLNGAHTAEIAMMTTINSSTPIELSVAAEDPAIAYLDTGPNPLIYRG